MEREEEEEEHWGQVDGQTWAPCQSAADVDGHFSSWMGPPCSGFSRTEPESPLSQGTLLFQPIFSFPLHIWLLISFKCWACFHWPGPHNQDWNSNSWNITSIYELSGHCKVHKYYNVACSCMMSSSRMLKHPSLSHGWTYIQAYWSHPKNVEIHSSLLDALNQYIAWFT